MSNYFPRQSVAWKLEEPPAFRRLTLGVAEMAIITGVVLRLVRSLWLTHGSTSWLSVGGYYAVFLLVLFGMATAHLGNFTIRKWAWRAPLFGAIEAAAEAATSLVLIAAQREPMGTARAEYQDWLGIASTLLVWRVLAVSLFALLLAGVVQFVRYALLRKDDRDSTAIAISEEQERHTAEHEAR